MCTLGITPESEWDLKLSFLVPLNILLLVKEPLDEFGRLIGGIALKLTNC